MAVVRTEPSTKTLTFALIGTSLVLAAAAVFVGIDDNLPGIALGLASAIAFVAAFSHGWRTARPFRRLFYLSLASGAVFALVSSMVEAATARGGISAALDTVLNAIWTTIMLFIPAGLVVGILGWLITGRRSVGAHTPAD